MRLAPPRPARTPLTWVAVTCTALTLAAAAGAQEDPAARSESFSASERADLEAGRLVVRRSTRHRGQARMIGGSAWQVVSHSPDVTWRALTDADHYSAMLPAAEDTRVVAHSPGERVVRVRHAVGLVHASYHLRLTYDHAQRDIAFRLDRQRPNDLRAAWGFLSVAPWGDDDEHALISYGVMADLGGGLFSGLMRSELHEWLLRVPETVRTYLDGPGGRRYQ